MGPEDMIGALDQQRPEVDIASILNRLVRSGLEGLMN
jgi:hypothetical protein